ncbi:MAG: stage II sporulation protein D [Clostridia bacterium]
MKRYKLWIIYICILCIFIYFSKYIISEQDKHKIEKKEDEIEKNVEEEKINQTIRVKMAKTGEIVAMDVNDYIRGVLPSEMPPSFEIEALKAQAIVARTYLYNKIENRSHADADICDNFAHCQAFYPKEKIIEIWKGRGFDDNTIKEYTEKINIATNETSNLAIKYKGKYIKAFFHANSGGKTEESDQIWGGEKLEYLRSVESLGEEEHKFYQTVTKINKEDFVNKIREKIDSMYKKQDKNIEIIDYTTSGRVKNVKVGSNTIKATTVRTLFELKSTNFTVEENENEIVFKVQGYGHGVGLSQTGANYYAKQGLNAESIILHYYTGVSVVNIDKK